MADLVYLKGSIASRIVQLEKQRRELGRKFRRLRDDMYMVRKELEQIDRDIRYYRKVLDKMNDNQN